MTIHDIIPIPDMFSFKKVLCIQPHPDDNEIGAGGTIALMHQNNQEISYLTVSRGKGGSSTMSSKELIAIRAQELIKAGSLLGAASFESLDLVDAHYPDQRTITELIVSVIRRVKPDLVLTIDPYLMYEAHPTHRNTGMAVLDACLFSSMKHFPIPDGDNEAVHRVQCIAFYASARPNTVIDITSTFELKLKAIQEHQTQFDQKAFKQLKDYLSFRAQTDGQKKGYQYAETFKVLPTIMTHMMVDSDLY
jgi:N,N'-diacetylchitobiose non-reducing end deacetylase